MGHREQNSSCPRHRQEIPRGFLTEWEATPLEPTEDAMQNDKAERLLNMLHESKAGRDIRNAVAALIRTQAARIAELEANLREMTRRRDEWRKKAEGFDAVRLALREKVGTPWPPHMSRLLWAGIAADEKKRADDAEAEIARLTAALAEAEARGYARGLEDAAEKAKDHLIDWASDLAETRDELISAQASGFFNGRKVRDNGWLKAQARRFNERAEAVAESADHTSAAIRALANKETGAVFPPPHCTAWEDCNHDGICHDPKCCGATGPNHEAFYGEAGE